MTELMTWSEVEEQLNGECTVLLGNGFSRSYCNSSFNQQEILSRMPSLSGLPNITDIEKCIQDTQDKVKELSPECTVPKTIIDSWIKKELHKEFINTLYDMMPKSLNDIADFTDEKLVLYRNFVNNFDKIFTLNYDPLLYWMLMRFLNYGDEDYVKYADLNEQLKNTDENSKDFDKLKKKVDSSNNKCMKSIRAEMYESYLKDKDYYKMAVTCKNKILIEKSINEAQKQFLIKWDKLSDGLYNALEEKKENDETLMVESQSLDNIASSALESKLNYIETNKEDLKIKINDGFDGENWHSEMSQTIFYLHGAFHFMEKDTGVAKVKSEDKKKMVDKIKEKWDDGYEPLTVLESSPDDKLERISQSAYLTKCFNELKNIKGTLVTHGLSFMGSDQHIINVINSNDNLERIYIGVYETVSTDIENAFKNNSKVIYFNTNGMFNS